MTTSEPDEAIVTPPGDEAVDTLSGEVQVLPYY